MKQGPAFTSERGYAMVALLVATGGQTTQMEAIDRQARSNGVDDLRRLSADEARASHSFSFGWIETAPTSMPSSAASAVRSTATRSCAAIIRSVAATPVSVGDGSATNSAAAPSPSRNPERRADQPRAL